MLYVLENTKIHKKIKNALEIPEDKIHGSITGKTMMHNMFPSFNNCYYSSSEPVIDEGDES